MLGIMKTWRGLKAKGVMGINDRNAHHILEYNRRRYYPIVDDKVLTKAQAARAGIKVPEKYDVIATERSIRRLRQLVEKHDDFVINPAQGAAGEGILVITDRFEGYFKTASGRLLTMVDLEFQISNILTGMYSLGGVRDRALIEYRVTPAPIFSKISFEGVPDIRIIVLLGYPVMAMLRLPTRQSDGKANLHQGAIGVGVNLSTGITLNGSLLNTIITKHPDTFNTVADITVPHWNEVMTLAAGCNELSQLDEIGVDMVLDEEKGPLMLEVNARPGLNIQIANNAGLAKRAQIIEAHVAQCLENNRQETPAQRVDIVQQLFA